MIVYCRRMNPDVVFFIHSDGNIMPVMEDLVDDLGFNMINPMQPECMDLKKIFRNFGDRIVMHGCGSLQKTLPFGSPEEVKREVRSIIDNLGQSGGLAVMPSNYIGFDIPIENIIAFYETARDYFPY